MTFTYTYDYEEDEEDAEEYGGPENDDWIHRAYEAQHPIKPEPYYDGGRLIHD